jgi:hypothetical protein
MRTKTQTNHPVPITSRMFLPPIPAHHRPRQTEGIVPEDKAHRREALSAGGECRSKLTRSDEEITHREVLNGRFTRRFTCKQC